MIDILRLDVSDFPKKTWPWYNDQFPPLDALTYWHFLKKAKRVVEVGCGYSTILPAILGKITAAIDPEPRFVISEVQYIRQEVQKVCTCHFWELEESDILFIDSSHIYSHGSDVEYLIHEIIPSLNKGVIVHFHDYFGTSGYPKSWKEHPELSKWNENEMVIDYVIKAHSPEMLSFNWWESNYRQNLLKSRYAFVPNDITQNLGAVKGASLWVKIK